MTGTVSARCDIELDEWLGQRGLRLLVARPTTLAARNRLMRQLAPRERSAPVIDLTGHLAELLQAGVEIDEALAQLAADTRSRRLAILLVAIREALCSGCRLSDALADWHGTFGPRYVAMVRAGEACGRVPESLRALERAMSRDRSVRERLLRRIGYPFAVSMLTLAIAVFVTIEIVPALLDLYRALDLPPPSFASGWAHVSMAELATRALGAALVLFTVGRIRRRFRTIPGRGSTRHLDRLPSGSFVSRVRHERAAARYADCVGLLYRHGVPLVEAMTVAERSLRAGRLLEECRMLRIRVAAGGSIGELAEASTVLPTVLASHAKRGERSGTLGEAFVQAGEVLSQRTERYIARLETGLPALAMLMTSGILVVLVQMVFMPLYELLVVTGLPT